MKNAIIVIVFTFAFCGICFLASEMMGKSEKEMNKQSHSILRAYRMGWRNGFLRGHKCKYKHLNEWGMLINQVSYGMHPNQNQEKSWLED